MVDGLSWTVVRGLRRSPPNFVPIHSTVFGIASAVGGQLRGPGFGCGFSIFILQVSALAH